MSNPTGDALAHSTAHLHNLVAAMPQDELSTEHVFHAGMYARTIRLHKGQVLSGAMIQIPTILIIQGVANFITDEGGFWVDGHRVLCGMAGRKTLLVAHSDLAMTMIFPTQAQTVEEAEREFTSEYEKLMSRKSDSDSVIHTGE